MRCQDHEGNDARRALSNPEDRLGRTAVNRDQTLARIEAAVDEGEVVHALRDFLGDPANAHDPRLANLLGNATDVPGIALELTRFRLAARSQEIGTADLEAVFARASVRLAELHDRTGRWKAYRQRPHPEGNVDAPPDTSAANPKKDRKT